jgi:predicted transcriptional regulator
MEVHLTRETEAQFSALASERGCDAEVLAQKVLGDYLEQARFIKAVEAGEAALDRGDYLTHEQMGTQVERLLRS